MRTIDGVRSIITQPPDPSGAIVRIDIFPIQLGDLGAIVNITSGNRRSLIAAVFGNRVNQTGVIAAGLWFDDCSDELTLLFVFLLFL